VRSADIPHAHGSDLPIRAQVIRSVNSACLYVALETTERYTRIPGVVPSFATTALSNRAPADAIQLSSSTAFIIAVAGTAARIFEVGGASPVPLVGALRSGSGEKLLATRSPMKPLGGNTWGAAQSSVDPIGPKHPSIHRGVGGPAVLVVAEFTPVVFASRRWAPPGADRQQSLRVSAVEAAHQ
jgi:hypothetical protein